MTNTTGGRGSMLLAELRPLPVACCAPVAAATMSEDQSRSTAQVFKALSDPSRVRIVNLLATSDGPVCVCNLTDELGLAQGTVSFHLKKLLATGLLQREQRGTWAYYSIDRDALRRVAAVFEPEGRRG